MSNKGCAKSGLRYCPERHVEVQGWQRVQEDGDGWNLNSAEVARGCGQYLRLIDLVVRNDLTGSRWNNRSLDGDARHRGGGRSCMRRKIDALLITR